MVMKNDSVGRNVLGDSRKRYIPLPVGRDRKIRTAQRTNQIAGFVTVPSEKKKEKTAIRINLR